MKRSLTILSILLFLIGCTTKIDYAKYLNGTRQNSIGDIEKQTYAYVMNAIEKGYFDEDYQKRSDILCLEIYYATQCHECIYAGMPNAVLWIKVGGYDLKREFLSMSYGIPIGGQVDGKLLSWYKVYEGDSGNYVSTDKINKLIIKHWEE